MEARHERKNGRGLTAQARLALRRVRTQAALVEQLSERLRAESPDGLCAIRTDEQRGGGGLPRGLDARMERREALGRILKKESAWLRTLEMDARAAMDSMTPELYAFCAMYYIGGMSLADTARAIDRSERQCLRYRRELEREDEEETD